MKEYRLPESLEPVHYDLFFQPFFKETQKPEYFEGTTRIEFKCVQDTSFLVLHMKDLELKDETLRLTSLTDKNYKEAKNFKYSYDSETHLFVAEFIPEQSFKKGETYVFEVEYKGFTKGDTIGLYRSTYKDGQTEKYMVSTQFEPVEARKAFICFDEPKYKATFTITIQHDSSLDAYSNMAEDGPLETMFLILIFYFKL